MTVQMSVYLQYDFFMFNYFIYLDIKPDGLSHRQNFKKPNPMIRFFYIQFLYYPYINQKFIFSCITYSYSLS